MRDTRSLDSWDIVETLVGRDTTTSGGSSVTLYSHSRGSHTSILPTTRIPFYLRALPTQGVYRGRGVDRFITPPLINRVTLKGQTTLLERPRGLTVSMNIVTCIPISSRGRQVYRPQVPSLHPVVSRERLRMGRYDSVDSTPRTGWNQLTSERRKGKSRSLQRTLKKQLKTTRNDL